MTTFTSHDGAELFYSDSAPGLAPQNDRSSLIGTGGSPVILIHGWPLNADMWENQKLALLRQGHRVITYDRRGFGRSSQPGSGYDFNTFADDLNSLIEHLDLQKVALVGFSMGGGEIARYLNRYGSEKISCATLISSVTPYLMEDESNPEGADESVFVEMIEKLEEDRPSFMTTFIKQFFGVKFVSHPVSPETEAWCMTMALQASLKASIDSVQSFGRTDFRADMSAFTIPTLIVHGTSDKTVPFSASGEVTSKLIPHAILKAYDSAPHGLFITHRKELNEDLIMFLEQHRIDTTANDFMKHKEPFAATTFNSLPS